MFVLSKQATNLHVMLTAEGLSPLRAPAAGEGER